VKLYQSITSPFARKVMVLLHETGALDSVELVTASGNPVDSGSMPVAKNPLGKIPVLERENAPAIYDSRVICRFLDTLNSVKMYPEGDRLWETLTIEATADGIMDAAILMVYEQRLRPEERRFDEWLDGQWQKIDRAIGVLNERWVSNLKGPLDMGHISVACALAYVEFRHPNRDWRSTNADLAEWFSVFSARESFRKTIPAG
jgi:glutathione S-transferase